jgi:hypothetical protein
VSGPIPNAMELIQVPDGSICTACEHSVADHDLQRATNLPPTLCRKCAIKGDICGGGVFRGPDKPKPSARELLRVGYEGEDVTPRLLILAARVEAVLALHVERAGWCIECSVDRSRQTYPCRTVRALNGEKP